MGWQALAIIGFQALSQVSGINAATKSAKAVAREGEYAAQQVADNTIRTTGKLTTSFLQSGITLEGGPMDVLKQAFSKGYTDISRIQTNANTEAKNIMSGARSKFIEKMASMIVPSAASSLSSFGNAAQNGFNNAATFQTGATPGAGNSWIPPWQQDQPLPWRRV